MSVKSDFNCDQCPRKFLQQGQLVVHMRQHTGEKPFVCEYCKKGFASSKVLKVHIRIHTGERPYKCPFCDRRFSAYANLVVHRRIHTNEKPYVCELCCRAFEHSGNLSRHFQAHLINDGFRCILCSKTFDKKEDILEHTKKIHTIDYERYISYGIPVKNCRQAMDNTVLTLSKDESKNTPSQDSEVMVISSSQAKCSKLSNNSDHENKINNASPQSRNFISELEHNDANYRSEKPSISDTMLMDAYRKDRSKNLSEEFINSVGNNHLNFRKKRPLSLSPSEHCSKLESYEEHKENEYYCKKLSNGLHLNSPPGNSSSFKESSSFNANSNSDQQFYPKKMAKLSNETVTSLYNSMEERSHNVTKSPPPLPPLIPIDQEFSNDCESESYCDFEIDHRNSPDNVNQREAYFEECRLNNNCDTTNRSNIINSLMKNEPYESKDFHNHINKLIHSIKMCFKEVMSSQSNGMEIWSKVERKLFSILQKFEIDLRKCLEVNYEQFLIHFLDAAGKNPCADVRVGERQRMEINMKKLLEISLQ